MAKTPKKLHAADAADIAAVATAVSFNAHLRLSPTKKINEPAATLIEAVRKADEIKAAHPGRNVLIYAITPAGTSVPVPFSMQDEARAKPLDQLGDLSSQGTGIDQEPVAAGQGEPLGDLIDEGKIATDEEVPGFLRRSHADQIAAVAPVDMNLGAASPADAEKAAAKAPRAPRKAAEPKPAGKRAAAIEAAQRGEMPAAPDFSANTHKPFRKKLAELIALVEAKDIAGLKAYKINPISSSPKAMDKYRNLAVIALEAQAANKAA